MGMENSEAVQQIVRGIFIDELNNAGEAAEAARLDGCTEMGDPSPISEAALRAMERIASPTGNDLAAVPHMTLIERLRYPLIAANEGQSFFDAEKALRSAAADRLESLTRDARELATGVLDTVGCLAPEEKMAVAARIIRTTS